MVFTKKPADTNRPVRVRCSRLLGLCALAALFLPCLAAATAAPPGPADLASRNPFGVATSASSQRLYARWMPRMRALGFRWVRMGVGWSDIEPARGKWNFRPLDHMITAAAHNHLFISSLFFYNSPWLKGSAGTLPVHHLHAWAQYVARLAAHTKGRIDYFEVWNEPESFAARATAADYGRLVRATYVAAKKANPRIRIGLSVHCVDVVYLQQAIRAGAANHFDFICVHPYEVLGALRFGWDADYMSIVPTIRKMLAAYDPAKVHVPIWVTEEGEQIGGWGATATTQTRDIVKAYVMGLAEGFARMNWYQAMDGNNVGMGLLTRAGKPRAAATAIATLMASLGPHPRYRGWVLLRGRDEGFVFSGPVGNMLCTWAPPGKPGHLTFARPVQVVQLTSGGARRPLGSGAPLRLAGAPVLVLHVPRALVAEAVRNRNAPFPWNGNYAKARQVVLWPGRHGGDHGLHQLNANATSTAVHVYGAGARLCDDAPGHVVQSFEVDPNFISLRPRHIAITVTARRNKANTPAGFVLGFESTTGLKHSGKAGWWNIPGNQRWYSHTFHLSHAEFVGMWAYNFDVNSDTVRKGGYYIRKIVVRKGR